MPTDRQYRPKPTGNAEQDVANRQIIDHIHDIRNNYGPTSIFAKGSGAAVNVPAAPIPATGISTQVTLTRPGQWLLTAAVALSIVSDNAQIFTLTLAVGGTVQSSHVAQWSQSADGQVMLHQTWIVTSSGKENCRLLIVKDGGAGTSSVNPLNSTLSALWQGPKN